MAFMIDLKGGPRLKSIPIDRISPNPDQPRRIFDETGLKELADSIAQLGTANQVCDFTTGSDAGGAVLF